MRSPLWAALAALAALAPGLGAPGTVRPAHGGSSQASTSNYRSTITAVEPADAGLRVTIVEGGSYIEATWRGTGSLVIEGYDGEPYLRIDAAGVARNTRSPATYLNQDRYARVSIPPTADSAAAPEWEHLSDGRAASWHDHRTHWMSPTPPLVVEQDRGEAHLLSEWTVPITVDGRIGSIAGRLEWRPPPSGTPWYLLAVAFGAVVLGLLSLRRWRRWAAVGFAAAGTAIVAVDGVGYVLAQRAPGGRAWAWTLGWPLVAAAATVWLLIESRRQRTQPSLALGVAGLVIAVVGGVDRLDSVTASQVFTALPVGVARAACAGALGIGAALTLRLLIDVIPAIFSGRAPQPSDGRAPAGG